MTVKVIADAAPGWPVSGAIVDDDRIHLVSRNLDGTRIAEIDLAGPILVREVTIPAGDGAWGLTLAPDGIYLGLFGARGKGNLFRLAAGRAAVVAALGVDYVWDLATGPDGVVYGVGSHPSLVFSYDPTTKRATDLGMVTGPQQPRTCTVVGGDLVVGGSARGRAFLLRRDRLGKTVTDILPAQLLRDRTVYCSTTLADGRLVVGTEGPDRTSPGLALIDPLKPERAAVVRLPREALIDTVTSSGTSVLATARPSGALYRTDLGGVGLLRLAVPVALSETRRLTPVSNDVVGASADGSVWIHDRPTRTTSTRSPTAMQLPMRPQRGQSICATPTSVLVGGSFSVTRHRMDGGPSQTRFVPGEPKAMVHSGDVTYMAIYPTAEIWAWAEAADVPRRLATLQTDQLRPIALVALERLGALVCSTTDDVSRGVVHTIDPVTGRVDTLTDPLGKQGVAGLQVSGTTLYVGGSGANPAVAAVDAVDGRRLWTVPDVVGDGGFVLGLQVVGGDLAVSTSRGWFTTIDLATRTVRKPVRMAPIAGQMRRAGRDVLLATGDAVLRIDVTSFRVDKVASGLDGQYWNWPPMDVDRSGAAWTMKGRSLARVTTST